jgi:hypothetical protein
MIRYWHYTELNQLEKSIWMSLHYAFYTPTIFRFEHKNLAIVLRISSTDENAKQLSLDQADCFSAWTVET